VALPLLSTPFWVAYEDQTGQMAERAGLDGLQPTNANSDAGRQVTDLRNLVTAGAEGVIVGPVDSKAIAPALDYAKQENVPVVAVDVAPEGGEVAMTVRADNKLMARRACEAMGKELAGKGKVLSLQGDLASINGRERTQGFTDCMKEKFPQIEVIERPTKWDAGRAASATQTTLTSNPDLAGIYMQSDGAFLASVLQAVKKGGKSAEDLALVSIDGTPEALDGIRDGKLDAVVSQPADLYAKYSVEYLEQAKAGKQFKPGPTDHDSEIVDYMGNPQDLLPSPLVTRENVDDKSLWGNNPKVAQ